MSSFKLKVLLLGGPDSQKSELMQKFIKNRFAANYKLTVGVDILTKDVEFKPQEVATLSIWDVGSQQRFDFIRSTFYKGAAGATIVFNLNRKTSLTQVASWIASLRKHAGQKIPICLVGNNIYSMEKDQEIEQEIQNLIDDENMIYIETSASGKYIEEMFVWLTTKIIENRRKYDGPSIPRLYYQPYNRTYSNEYKLPIRSLVVVLIFCLVLIMILFIRAITYRMG